jgi:c-di-GMP-binding flagellar brake protein YcgR
MPAHVPEETATQEVDRRRSPRFSCAGLAQIICLPSDGIFLPGRIRDLSLGGCSVLAPRSLTCGALTEILVRVNASSFRAVGQIRALHGPSSMGIQFLQMSAGGQDMLVELIRELARQRAIAQTVQAARNEPDAELFIQQRAAVLSIGLPLGETVVSLESGEKKTIAVDRQALIVSADLDLFI